MNKATGWLKGLEVAGGGAHHQPHPSGKTRSPSPNWGSGSWSCISRATPTVYPATPTARSGGAAPVCGAGPARHSGPSRKPSTTNANRLDARPRDAPVVKSPWSDQPTRPSRRPISAFLPVTPKVPGPIPSDPVPVTSVAVP